MTAPQIFVHLKKYVFKKGRGGISFECFVLSLKKIIDGKTSQSQKKTARCLLFFGRSWDSLKCFFHSKNRSFTQPLCHEKLWHQFNGHVCCFCFKSLGFYTVKKKNDSSSQRLLREQLPNSSEGLGKNLNLNIAKKKHTHVLTMTKNTQIRRPMKTRLKKLKLFAVVNPKI